MVQVVLGTLIQVALGTWCKWYLVYGASCNHSPSGIIVTLCLVRITSTVSILHCIFLVLCSGVSLNVVILACHCTLYTDINL